MVGEEDSRALTAILACVVAFELSHIVDAERHERGRFGDAADRRKHPRALGVFLTLLLEDVEMRPRTSGLFGNARDQTLAADRVAEPDVTQSERRAVGNIADIHKATPRLARYIRTSSA